MNKSQQMIIAALSLLLFMDLLRPFGYTLQVEFLFIGLVIVFLYYPARFSFIIAISAGYIKDVLSFHNLPIYLIESCFLLFMVRYMRAHFNKKIVKIAAIIFSIFIHIILNCLYRETFSFLFGAHFFMHTFFLFFFIDFLLKERIRVWS